MALQFCYFIPLVLHMYQATITSATTSVHFYTDNECQNLSVIVQTDTNAWNGDCGQVQGIQSVNPSMVDFGCAGNKLSII